MLPPAISIAPDDHPEQEQLPAREHRTRRDRDAVQAATNSVHGQVERVDDIANAGEARQAPMVFGAARSARFRP